MSNYETEQAKEFREKEGKLVDAVKYLQSALNESIALLLIASLYHGISDITIVSLRKYAETVNQFKISFVDGVFQIKIPAQLMKFGRKSLNTHFERDDENIQLILEEISRIKAYLEEKASTVEVKQPNLKDQVFTNQEIAFKNLKEAFVDYSKI